MSRRFVSPNPPLTNQAPIALGSTFMAQPAGQLGTSGQSRSSSPVAGSDPASDPSRSGSPASFISSTSASFLVPGLTDIQKLYEAYLKSQSRVAELEKENGQLKQQLADIKIGSSRSQSTASTSKDGAEDSDPESQLISKYGAHHTLFYHMFQLSPDVFTAPRPAFSSISLDRFSAPQKKEAGLTAELYEHLPASLHPMMAVAPTKGKPVSNFVRIFWKAQGAIRSTVLLNLRNEASSIFSLPAMYFNGSYALPRDMIPEIQLLLGITVTPGAANAKPMVAYERFPPILCLNGDASKPENRFSSSEVFIIGRIMVFGKKAKDKARAVARTTSACLLLDEPAKTTFGFIAAASIFTRYILSKDERFDNSGIGPQTQINYATEFEFYIRWLIEMYLNPASAPWVKGLLTLWDNNVFYEHNKAKNLLSEQQVAAEVVNIDDAELIRRDMDQLHIANSTTSASDNNPTPSSEQVVEPSNGTEDRETAASTTANVSSSQPDSTTGPCELSEPMPMPNPPPARATRSRTKAQDIPVDQGNVRASQGNAASRVSRRGRT